MSIGRGREDIKIVKEKFYSNRHFKKIMLETFEKIKADPFPYILVLWIIFTGLSVLFDKELSWKWYSVFWLTLVGYLIISFTKEVKNDIIKINQFFDK